MPVILAKIWSIFIYFNITFLCLYFRKRRPEDGFSDREPSTGILIIILYLLVHKYIRNIRKTCTKSSLYIPVKVQSDTSSPVCIEYVPFM